MHAALFPIKLVQKKPHFNNTKKSYYDLIYDINKNSSDEKAEN